MKKESHCQIEEGDNNFALISQKYAWQEFFYFLVHLGKNLSRYPHSLQSLSPSL